MNDQVAPSAPPDESMLPESDASSHPRAEPQHSENVAATNPEVAPRVETPAPAPEDGSASERTPAAEPAPAEGSPSAVEMADMEEDEPSAEPDLADMEGDTVADTAADGDGDDTEWNPYKNVAGISDGTEG
eukprot:1034760-Pyramimonas_sp.AAC.1